MKKIISVLLFGAFVTPTAMAGSKYNACIIRSYEWVRTNYAITHCDGKLISRVEKPDSEASIPTLMTGAMNTLMEQGMQLQDCDLSATENEKYICILTGKK